MNATTSSVISDSNSYSFDIVIDDYLQSPREENCNITTMICWHSRYNLGDKQMSNPLSEEEVMEMYADIVAIKPIYLYDHGGITINTGGFSCPWDSGMVGWAFITKSSLSDMGLISQADDLDKMNLIIENEIKEYDSYLRGEIYAYLVKDARGNVVECCGGFYSKSDAEEHANEAIKLFY